MFVVDRYKPSSWKRWVPTDLMSDGAAPTFDIRIVNALGETTTVSCLDRDEVSKLPDCVHCVAWTWDLIS